MQLTAIFAINRVEIQQSSTSYCYESFVCEFDYEWWSAVLDKSCFVDFESCCCGCCCYWWADGRGFGGCGWAGVGTVDYIYRILCIKM